MCIRDSGVDAEDESEVPKLRGHELIDDFIQKSESSGCLLYTSEEYHRADIHH